MNSLPPLGSVTPTDHRGVVTHLGDLARESTDAARLWQGMGDICHVIYSWGKYPKPEDEELIVHEIQDAVISITDIQTKEPPGATLEPVENGEEPVVYWNGPQEHGIALLGLSAQQVAVWRDNAGELHAPAPLDEMQAHQAGLLVTSQQIPEKWVVEVNDRLVAETYQAVFDVYWTRSGTDRFIRSNILTTNVQGWLFGLYQFDEDEQKHLLENLSIRQVYIDPTVEDIADAAYAGFDLPIDVHKAKKLFPHLAVAIDSAATDGVPDRPDSSVSWGHAYERSFQRDMVVFRVFWIRNQEIPYTKEQAVAMGLVEEVPLAPQPTAAAEGAEAVADPAAEPIPVVCVLAGTETVVMPGDENWPTRRGIRQLTVIDEELVDDRENEHWDIPLLHNVCIPVPGKPFGIGEPWRLRGLQDARSRMMGSLVEHCDYFKAPITNIPQSVYDQFKKEMEEDAHVEPGLMLVWPDKMYSDLGGKPLNIVEPPQTPPALVDMQGILKNELSERSGHAEVLQGRAQPQIKSGKAIEMLQTAAASVIGFKSQRTSDVVYRLSMLMLHQIVWRLEVADVARIVSKYKRHVLQAIHERARAIEWNVSVLVSGNGVQAQKKQQAVNEFQVGAITKQTLRERLGIDHHQEQQREQAEIEKVIQQQAQTGQQPQGGAEQSLPPT